MRHMGMPHHFSEWCIVNLGPLPPRLRHLIDSPSVLTILPHLLTSALK
jgi:hypothetical protein